MFETDLKNYSTPHYNSLILQDLVMDQNEALLKEIIDTNPSVQDALILLKIWLTQKNLGVSSTPFMIFIKLYLCNFYLNFRVSEILQIIYCLCM